MKIRNRNGLAYGAVAFSIQKLPLKYNTRKAFLKDKDYFSDFLPAIGNKNI